MRALKKGEAYYVLQKEKGQAGSVFISRIVKSIEDFSGHTRYGWKLRGVISLLGPYKSLETAEARASAWPYKPNPSRRRAKGKPHRPIRRKLSERERWQEYEREKAVLYRKNLSPSEYDKAIREIIRRLGL